MDDFDSFADDGGKRLDRRYTRGEIASMTEEELVDCKDVIQTNLNRAMSFLGARKADALTTGVYADPHWFQKCKGAIRVLQQLLEFANRRLKTLQKGANEKMLCRFVNLVRAEVGERKVRELLDRAKDGEGYDA